MNDDWKQWHFAGIYCIKNTETNRVYVGQSKTIYKRIRAHVYYEYKGKLHDDAEKYGWDKFEFILLEKIDDMRIIDEREEFWINKLNACDKGFGYNIHPKVKFNKSHNNDNKIKVIDDRLCTYRVITITGINALDPIASEGTASNIAHDVMFNYNYKNDENQWHLEKFEMLNQTTARYYFSP